MQQVNPVFSDNKLPLNGETYCFLGEITRDTNYSCFGGQKLIYGSYEEILRELEDDITPRLLENGEYRVLDQETIVDGSEHIVAIPASLMHNI